MCMLHGVTMLQVDATPIWGLAKSSFVNPVAYNMPRLGARSMPSTTMDEKVRVAAVGFRERAAAFLLMKRARL